MESSLTAYVSKMVERYALEPFAKDSGYRLPRAPTLEDRQRAQLVRQDPSGCFSYSLDQGDEMLRFAQATIPERKWKRMGILAKMFVRQADIGFTFTAHEIYMERRREAQIKFVMAEYGGHAGVVIGSGMHQMRRRLGDLRVGGHRPT